MYVPALGGVPARGTACEQNSYSTVDHPTVGKAAGTAATNTTERELPRVKPTTFHARSQKKKTSSTPQNLPRESARKLLSTTLQNLLRESAQKNLVNHTSEPPPRVRVHHTPPPP